MESAVKWEIYSAHKSTSGVVNSFTFLLTARESSDEHNAADDQ